LQLIKDFPSHFLLPVAIFFLSLLGLFYSSHKSNASLLIERQLSILLLPIIAGLYYKNINTQKVLSWFSSGVLIACIYLFYFNIKTALRLDSPFFQTLFSGAFFNHRFTAPLQSHAVYFSLYVSLAIFYYFEKYNSLLNFFQKTFIIISLFVLLAALLFLASRNVLIAFTFILVIIYPVFFLKLKPIFYFFLFLFMSVLYFSFERIPYLKNRFSSELVSDFKGIEVNMSTNFNMAEPRVERWKGAIALISLSPIIGIGTGDEIPLLKTEYIKRDLCISYLEGFNAHNQYLSILLKHGIIGLFLFLFVFYNFLLRAYRKRHFLFLSFLVLLLFSFYTENILDTIKGIFFFSFFTVLFLMAIIEKDYINSIPD
jgi:O-antigen ligase